MCRRFAAVSLCVLAGALASGCGNRRSGPPDLTTPNRPGKIDQYAYAEEQLRFDAPRNWVQHTARPPVVATLISGRATVNVWRYRRRGRLPSTEAELRDAQAALADAARARDRTLMIRSTRVVTVHGAPGIELVADETVAGQPRRVRSTHLFAHGAEYVIDASAPPNVFELADRTVFVPLVASVRAGPVPKRKR